jgi:photosystem II stability/assembly factor-like uncharacterized protein
VGSLLQAILRSAIRVAVVLGEVWRSIVGKGQWWKPRQPLLPGLVVVRAESIGVSGGGSLYSPCIASDGTLFVSCDMGGIYRSQDSGATWTLLDTHRVAGGAVSEEGRGWAVCCHPSNSQIIVAYGECDQGPGQAGFVSYSTDGGESWKAQTVGSAPVTAFQTTTLAIDPSAASASPVSGRLIIGGANGIFYSDDGGASWNGATPALQDVIELVVVTDASASQTVALAASSSGGLYESTTHGQSWTRISSTKAVSVAAAISAGTTVVYVVTTTGDIEVTTNGGMNWTPVPRSGANYTRVRCAPSDIEVVYAAQDSKPYLVVSNTQGQNWSPSIGATVPAVDQGWVDLDLNWGFGVHDLAVNPGSAPSPSAARALLVNNQAAYVLTARSGGTAVWQQAYATNAGPSPPSSQQPWLSNGLDITTSWKYAPSPDLGATRFLCMTDVFLARSDDATNEWTFLSHLNPWYAHNGNPNAQAYNTAYDLIFDGADAWIAASSLHDIPASEEVLGVYQTSTPLGSGGVIRWPISGQTGIDENDGLPTVEVTIDQNPAAGTFADACPPITSLALADNGRLYCACFAVGVYYRDAGSTTWVACATQPVAAGQTAVPPNQHVHKLRWINGRLYCSITGMLNASGSWIGQSSGLFVSTDGGNSWSELTATISGGLTHVTGYDVSDDGQTIFVCTGATQPQGGALYRSADGGASWTNVLHDPLPSSATRPPRSVWLSCASVRIDDDPSRVILATYSHGLWYSLTGGDQGTWYELDVPATSPSAASIPGTLALPPQQITPRAFTDLLIAPSSLIDTIEMYATTFGFGAWLIVARPPTLKRTGPWWWRSSTRNKTPA